MFLTVLILSSILKDFQADAFINNSYPIEQEANKEFAQLPSPKRCAGMTVRACENSRLRELRECKICGLINNDRTGPTFLVNNGIDVNPEYLYPWMVQIKILKTKGWTRTCGGAIISKNYILTAAHCIFDKSKKRDSEYATRQYLPDEMRVGFLTENYTITSVSAIEESIHHPYFNQSDMKYDVALLKLKNNIICNKYRNPICLPPANFHPKENAIFNFAGWGKTCGNPPESYPRKLLEGQARLVSDSQCRRPLNNIAYCLMGVDNRMPCAGDSGGPLFFRRNRRTFYTAGVASFIVSEEKEACKSCLPDKPFVYTSIPNVVPWITEITNLSPFK